MFYSRLSRTAALTELFPQRMLSVASGLSRSWGVEMLEPYDHGLTWAQRWILPAFPPVAAGYAIRCFWGQIGRGPNYTGIENIMPLNLWGVLFAAAAVACGAALALRKHRGTRTLFGAGLAILAVAMVGWSVGLGMVDFLNEEDKFTMWWVPSIFIAWVSAVMLRSLERTREEMK